MNREPWVDTQAAADHLGKSVFTVRRWAQSGEIPATKKGKSWMFQISAIDEKLQATPDPWVQSPRSRGRRRVA